MTDQDLIKKIKSLKKIQPSQEWLGSARHNLINRVRLSDNSQPQNVLNFWSWLKQFQATALVGCLLLNLIVGPWLIVKAAGSSLPGELLYSIKKMSESVQARVASKEEVIQLEFANRRLEELNKIAAKFATTKETKKVVDDLKSNLADASLNLKDNISKEEAVAVAVKTKKIKEDLIKVQDEVPEDIKADLAEADKSIEDIKYQILTVLTEGNESGTVATSSQDEEIIIFLKGTQSASSTECDLK